MLIEFLTGTLSPEDASNSVTDNKFMMAPKKVDNDLQILKLQRTLRGEEQERRSTSMTQPLTPNMGTKFLRAFQI